MVSHRFRVSRAAPQCDAKERDAQESARVVPRHAARLAVVGQCSATASLQQPRWKGSAPSMQGLSKHAGRAAVRRDATRTPRALGRTGISFSPRRRANSHAAQSSRPGLAPHTHLVQQHRELTLYLQWRIVVSWILWKPTTFEKQWLGRSTVIAKWDSGVMSWRNFDRVNPPHNST